jgi:hypothetical protein
MQATSFCFYGSILLRVVQLKICLVHTSMKICREVVCKDLVKQLFNFNKNVTNIMKFEEKVPFWSQKCH